MNIGQSGEKLQTTKGTFSSPTFSRNLEVRLRLPVLFIADSAHLLRLHFEHGRRGCSPETHPLSTSPINPHAFTRLFRESTPTHHVRRNGHHSRRRTGVESHRDGNADLQPKEEENETKDKPNENAFREQKSEKFSLPCPRDSGRCAERAPKRAGLISATLLPPDGRIPHCVRTRSQGVVNATRVASEICPTRQISVAICPRQLGRLEVGCVAAGTRRAT